MCHSPQAPIPFPATGKIATNVSSRLLFVGRIHEQQLR